MDVMCIGADGLLIVPKRWYDDRGYFQEIWNEEHYKLFDIQENWKQVNHSFTRRKGLRGLHYRDNETKLITVISGKIMDVVVDIRPESKTFGVYQKLPLSAGDQLYIPAGLAHGFCTDTDAHVVYMTTQVYNPKLSRGLAWNDPDLNIDWGGSEFEISENDQNNPSWREYVENLDTRRNGDAGNSVR